LEFRASVGFINKEYKPHFQIIIITVVVVCLRHTRIKIHKSNQSFYVVHHFKQNMTMLNMDPEETKGMQERCGV